MKSGNGLSLLCNHQRICSRVGHYFPSGLGESASHNGSNASHCGTAAARRQTACAHVARHSAVPFGQAKAGPVIQSTHREQLHLQDGGRRADLDGVAQWRPRAVHLQPADLQPTVLVSHQ